MLPLLQWLNMRLEWRARSYLGRFFPFENIILQMLGFLCRSLGTSATASDSSCLIDQRIGGFSVASGEKWRRRMLRDCRIGGNFILFFEQKVQSYSLFFVICQYIRESYSAVERPPFLVFLLCINILIINAHLSKHSSERSFPKINSKQTINMLRSVKYVVITSMIRQVLSRSIKGVNESKSYQYPLEQFIFHPIIDHPLQINASTPVQQIIRLTCKSIA